ncbi:NACHT domain-containing protein [Cylindrospermum sp. FACHB-282]|uniref:NACHT domain-containing protein n=1 Tax=Cylindrospermum sp. FACHB-282 TaxID=2692794 RepID=UPI001684F3A4|nr:NACHT domain-containing protein [Cylindrospermum sp. FACHB-282]MBD2385966.1 NACHT domain-containing protein [Cylindrospermum sp. FACHB-282]
MGQNQNIDNSSLENSAIQQAQAGRDTVSFQNSQDNQVTINNIILRLFGKLEPRQVDWDWGKLLLEQKQLPDIRQRLADTLGQKRLSLNVSLKEQPSWVSRTLQINGQDYGTLDADKLLIETYARDDIEGKLLILGAPGAGKTTALLSLAEELVRGALKNPQTVIPVIFELSTWRDDNQSIENWLIEQLYELHGGNRKYKIYERWLEKRVLLPLLDGLDELGLERQKKCTIKLKEFAKHYPQLVVCCRLKEFEAANLKLNTLRGAVCLQPLSDSQIQNYLHSLKRPELWSAIQKNPHLQTLLEPTPEGEPGLLRVPLFLKLTADVYDPQQPISGKADLLEKYIERQLSKDTREQARRQDLKQGWAYKTVKDEPHWRQTRSTLSWIARQLQANNKVELLIEQMQPSWIEFEQLRLRYWLRYRLIRGLFGGLFGGLMGELIIGLIGGLDKIEPVEAFQISMSRAARREILNSLRDWLIIGLIIGLIGGLIGGLIIGLIGGLISGLNIGLSIGLIYGLKQELKVRSHPNQGIWNSLQSMLWTTAFIYPLSVIYVMALAVAGTVVEKHNWLDLLGIFSRKQSQLLLHGLLMALSFGFFYGGGLACVQHLSLRFVLWQSGVPWNLARFLNYCVERRLLLRVGGRYRFLHRELLDHFAESNNS